MGWSHFPFSMDVVEAQPLPSANPPMKPELMSVRIPYGSRLRPSGVKVQTRLHSWVLQIITLSLYNIHKERGNETIPSVRLIKNHSDNI